MEVMMRRHPRLVGAAIILIGAGLALWLKHAYDTGDSIRENTIIAVPVALLYGLAIMVQPRLMLLKGEFASAPLRDKMMVVLIALAGVGLGFLLRYQVFGAWQ